MTRWQLQEAKARLGELIKKAAKEGPQSITIHGEPTAVVLSGAPVFPKFPVDFIIGNT